MNPYDLSQRNYAFDQLDGQRHHADCGRPVFRARRGAVLSGIVRLFATAEFIHQLSRAAQEPDTDPILRLATTLPQFPVVPGLADEPRTGELASLIFPSCQGLLELRTRERCEILHVATTIHYGAAGFVTSAGAILRKRDDLHQPYGIDVIGPTELAELYLPNQWTPTHLEALSACGTPLNVTDISEIQRKTAEGFLRSCSWSEDQIAQALKTGHVACPRHRVLVSAAGAPLAFASWEAPRSPRAPGAGWLAMAPQHPLGELAADLLMEQMTRDVCANRPAVLLKEVERYVLDKTPIAVWRVLLQIPTKKGNQPSVDTSQPREEKGTIPDRHERHDDIGFTSHDDGSISVDIDDDEIIRGIITGTKIDFKMVMTPKKLHMLGRFLGKVGLGILAIRMGVATTSRMPPSTASWPSRKQHTSKAKKKRI